MKTWKKYAAGLAAAAGLTPVLHAQLAVPTAPPLPGGVAPAVPALPGSPLINLLCPSPEQKEALRQKFCNSPLGQLINNGLKPLSALTGGILGNCCPPNLPNAADLKKGGAEGLAAQIQAEEANAKARRAAARYLGTVDCHYFPEVGEALRDLLRKDRNECVRWEAALSLGRGCCCNKVTIQALALTVSGSEKDGNPSEKSDRVKQAAAASLAHCLACVGTVPAEPKSDVPIKPPETTPIKPPESGDKTTQVPGTLPLTGISQSAYYKKIESMPLDVIVEEARKALADLNVSEVVAHRNGPRSLADLADYVMNGPTTTQADASPSVPETARVATPEPPVARVAAPEPPPVMQAPKPAVYTTPQPAPIPAPVVNSSYAPKAQPVPPAVQQMPAVPRPAPAWQAAPQTQSGSATPVAAPQAQLGGAVNVQQMLTVLHDSAYSEQREWAAERLAAVNPQSHPHVVQAVLKAAKEDTAPMVQVACIRCLAKMGCNTRDVTAALEALKGNSDPRVRVEAGQALSRLGGGQAVLPASFKR